MDISGILKPTCIANFNLCTYQSQAGRGNRQGIGQGFDRSLWPRGRAFELSCCPGGRDI